MQMIAVTAWCHYNTKIQSAAFRLWRSEHKHLLRAMQLNRLVQTGIRRMLTNPGPRGLLRRVVHAWRQLLAEQKARAQGGLAALCFAATYCAWPRPATAVPVLATELATPAPAEADSEEATPEHAPQHASEHNHAYALEA